MEFDDKKLLILGISILIVGIGFLGYTNMNSISKDSLDKNSSETISFNLEANTSDIDSVEVNTGYLSVDDMYNLETPEISLESETCLRFYNYSGTVNVEDRMLEGQADGFATCTLNASVDLNINEKVDDMWKVSTRELENTKSFSFEASQLYVNPLDLSQEINETDQEVEIKNYRGKMELYPPTGIKLFGEGELVIGDQELNSSS